MKNCNRDVSSLNRQQRPHYRLLEQLFYHNYRFQHQLLWQGVMHVLVPVKIRVIELVCILVSIRVVAIAEVLAKVHAKGHAKIGAKMPQKTILKPSYLIGRYRTANLKGVGVILNCYNNENKQKRRTAVATRVL